MFGRTAEEKAIARGLDYQNSENYEKAEHEFRRALKINENSSDAYYQLGVLFKIQNKNNEAIANYKKALEIDPMNSKAHYMLKLLTDADAVLSSQAPGMGTAPVKPVVSAGVKTDYEKLKNDLKKDIKNSYEAGVEFAKQENYTQAINHWEKTIKLNPSNVKARYNLAVAFLRTGHPVKATAQLRQAQKINPGYQQVKEALEKLTNKTS